MALFNASLTGGSGGDSNLVLSSTLVAGQTTLVITDERITSESVLDDIYTSIFGMKVKSAVINEGNVTIEFPVQEENMEVSVSLNIGTDKEIIGNGKSAYQYAVDGGFEGTEAEFVELMGDIAGIEDKVESILNSAMEWKEIYNHSHYFSSQGAYNYNPNINLKLYKEVIINMTYQGSTSSRHYYIQNIYETQGELSIWNDAKSSKFSLAISNYVIGQQSFGGSSGSTLEVKIYAR